MAGKAAIESDHGFVEVRSRSKAFIIVSNKSHELEDIPFFFGSLVSDQLFLMHFCSSRRVHHYTPYGQWRVYGEEYSGVVL